MWKRENKKRQGKIDDEKKGGKRGHLMRKTGNKDKVGETVTKGEEEAYVNHSFTSSA